MNKKKLWDNETAFIYSPNAEEFIFYPKDKVFGNQQIS
jgi:hypothetical protein